MIEPQTQETISNSICAWELCTAAAAAAEAEQNQRHTHTQIDMRWPTLPQLFCS